MLPSVWSEDAIGKTLRGLAIATAFLATSAWLGATPQIVRACPFCNAAMQTLSEEIASSDMAVIARRSSAVSEDAVANAAPADADSAPGAAIPPTKFRVVDVLHGGDQLAEGQEIEVVYFGDDPADKLFLISALKLEDQAEWTTPIPLSERAVEYVRKLPLLPAAGADRLAFFQEHLEDADRLLAQDSYDEFSRSPYEAVIALGPRMHRERLLAWIDDANVGPSGRRLYVTMLGVCAKPEDVMLLEQMLNYDYQALEPGVAAALAAWAIGGTPATAGVIDEIIHADERRKKDSLDALIACYLKLKGPAGLALINERFLANPQVEYKYLHAALMALRFHGEQTDVLPREALLNSMRLALDHKDFADQVIPDLTRWDDWEVMPRLVNMFKQSSADDWIRQPVASYLLVAADQPGEVGDRAKAAIAEVDAIDHEVVERARELSAFSLMPRMGAAASAVAAQASAPVDNASDPVVPAVAPPGADQTSIAPVAATSPPNRMKIIGIPLLAVVVLLAILAVLLRGADPRSSDDNL